MIFHKASVTLNPVEVHLIYPHYHKSSNCLEYPKNPYLNQATQKTASIIPVTWNLAYPPWI